MEDCHRFEKLLNRHNSAMVWGMKFGMKVHSDPLKPIATDKNLILRKPRWPPTDCQTCPRSIYSKQLSKVQNRYGADADGGAYWRRLANAIETSVCGGDAALCQITVTTCYYYCIGRTVQMFVLTLLTLHGSSTAAEQQRPTSNQRTFLEDMWKTHLDPAVTSSATATILRCHRRLLTRSMRRSLKWNFIVNNGAYSQPSDSAAFLIWTNQSPSLTHFARSCFFVRLFYSFKTIHKWRQVIQ